jgi:hypothetical protein
MGLFLRKGRGAQPNQYYGAPRPFLIMTTHGVMPSEDEASANNKHPSSLPWASTKDPHNIGFWICSMILTGHY